MLGASPIFLFAPIEKVRSPETCADCLDYGVVRRYLTNMRTTVSTKGQIVLPAEIRERDDIRAGEIFEIESIDRGQYKLTRVQGRRNCGLVQMLLACPVKGWFRPFERSETTDSIEPAGLG